MTGRANEMGQQGADLEGAGAARLNGASMELTSLLLPALCHERERYVAFEVPVMEALGLCKLDRRLITVTG